MKILVLGGGISGEREVSLRSAKNVEEALKKAGFDVLFYDPKQGMKGLLELSKKVEAVFPFLHGLGGEDGTLQSLLDKHQVKYLGSKPPSLRKTIDKAVFKQICQKHGVLTPKWEIVSLETIHNSLLVKNPFVLKPIRGGSAIDTFIIRKLPADFALIEKPLKKYKKMLLEELIEGKEITVGILGNKALPPVEIIPPEGEEFDFENRYNGRSQELCPPVGVSKDLQNKAQETALEVHKILGCRHLSRIDMIIRGNEIYVLELNSIPGMTKPSLYPKEALAAGLSFADLMKGFVNLALNE